MVRASLTPCARVTRRLCGRLCSARDGKCGADLEKYELWRGVNRRTHSRVSFSLYQYPWGEEREKK